MDKRNYQIVKKNNRYNIIEGERVIDISLGDYKRKPAKDLNLSQLREALEMIYNPRRDDSVVLVPSGDSVDEIIRFDSRPLRGIEFKVVEELRNELKPVLDYAQRKNIEYTEYLEELQRDIDSGKRGFNFERARDAATIARIVASEVRSGLR